MARAVRKFKLGLIVRALFTCNGTIHNDDVMTIEVDDDDLNNGVLEGQVGLLYEEGQGDCG